jgi:hypothetical protein
VVGVYSTSYQWQKLVGGFAPGLPTWIAGGPVANTATYCDGQSFGGGVAWLVQSGDPNFDTDVLCPAGLANYKVAFARPAPFAVPRYSVAGVVSSAPTPAAPPTPPPARPAIALPPPVALPPARPPAGHGRGVPVDLLVGGVLMLVAGGVSRQRARSRE